MSIEIAKLIPQLGDLGKIPTKVVFFLCLSSGFLLLAPDAVIARLRTHKLIDDHGLWVSPLWNTKPSFGPN